MTKPIDSFSGEYRFLSNFWMARVTIGDIDWLTIWNSKTTG